MKDDDILESFIELVKESSTYSKCVQIDVIKEIISIFDFPCEKRQYPKEITNCLEIALQFYQEYNYEYYKILINGINSKKIVISGDVNKPYMDVREKKAYIKLYGNDGDLYILVHEFAHFIDRCSNPTIVPDQYNFLCEVFSFYIEKQLEKYLQRQNGKYDELISVRSNNRIFFESEMTKNIESQLYYERLYKINGKIDKEEVDVNKARELLNYNFTDVVNYLLRYPLGNILSDYIINYDLFDKDCNICEICFKIDLRVALYDFFANSRIKRNKRSKL